MDFKKYNSIENADRTKIINYITEQGLSGGEWSVTEKVHGSNFSFYITSSEIKVAKRTSFLGVGQKFFNFEEVLDDHLDRMKLLFVLVSEFLNPKEADLSGDDLEIILYGELFGGTYPHEDVEAIPGSTKVQKGVFYSPLNNFYAFDMKVNGRFINTDIFEEIMEEVGIFYAKTLFKGTFEEALQYPNEFQTTLPKRLGLPEIENNVCEGVVIKPTSVKFFGSGDRVILKNKNEKFTEVSHRKDKGVKVSENYDLSEEENFIYVIALAYVTESRLRNVISKIGEVTDKMFGKLQGMFMKDVITDFRKDFSHSTKFLCLDDSFEILCVEKLNTIEKDRVKVIQRKLNYDVKELVRKNFLDIIDGTF